MLMGFLLAHAEIEKMAVSISGLTFDHLLPCCPSGCPSTTAPPWAYISQKETRTLGYGGYRWLGEAWTYVLRRVDKPAFDCESKGLDESSWDYRGRRHSPGHQVCGTALLSLIRCCSNYLPARQRPKFWRMSPSTKLISCYHIHFPRMYC